MGVIEAPLQHTYAYLAADSHSERFMFLEETVKNDLNNRINFDWNNFMNAKYLKTKSLWLVYDFDLGGDIPGLYKWLDSKNALECGNGVAFLKFEFEENFYQELKEELMKHVAIQNKDRIYIIYRDPKKMRGKFLSGERKKNPWAGYALVGVETEEEVDEVEEEEESEV